MNSMIITTKDGTVYYAPDDRADKNIAEFCNSNKLLFSYIKIALKDIDEKSKVKRECNVRSTNH